MADPAPPPESVEDGVYPPYVKTPEERERWDKALTVARSTLGTENRAAVWLAARSLYFSEIPT